MGQSQHNRVTDASIVKLLCQLPHYQTWDQITLPDKLQMTLDQADQQRLMCIVAYSLRRLMDDGPDESHRASA